MKLTIEGTAEEIKKALQAIASSEEQGEAEEMARDTLPGFRYLKKISGIADIPSGDINNPIAEPIQCNLSKVELDKDTKEKGGGISEINNRRNGRRNQKSAPSYCE